MHNGLFSILSRPVIDEVPHFEQWAQSREQHIDLLLHLLPVLLGVPGAVGSPQCSPSPAAALALLQSTTTLSRALSSSVPAEGEMRNQEMWTLESQPCL